MKFNVEMSKKELRRVLKEEPVNTFFKNVGTGMRRLNTKLKRSFRRTPFKATATIITIFVLCLCLFGFLKMSYNAGYRDSEFHHKMYDSIQEDKATVEHFEDRSLKDVASWFAKSVLLAIGNNLVILFFIVGLAWLIHGVGFKIL